MGKYQQGLLGQIQGKVGTGVFGRWKDKQVVHAYTRLVSNPRTTDQQLVRSRFAALGRLSSVFYQALQLGMADSLLVRRMTEGNVFVKRNWHNVTAVSPDDVSINYSSLVLSEGHLPEATFGVVDYGTTSHLHIEVQMQGGADQPGAHAEDEVYLFAYCPEKQAGVLGTAAHRSADKVSVNVPTSWDGMEVHLYAFIVGAKQGPNYRQTTPTAYCGSGEVA